MTIETLIAERGISRTVLRYARALDDRDWTTFRSLFTDEVEIDDSGLTGKATRLMSLDQWVSHARGTVELFEKTLHYSTNHQITFDGDRAKCDSYGYAQHTYADNTGPKRFVVYGLYTHSMRKAASGWLISGMKLDFRIVDGAPPPLPPSATE